MTIRTIRGTVDLAASTKESLAHEVECDVDPTGAPPEYLLTAKGATDASGTWVAGTWLTAYDAETKTATAGTPIIGAALAISPKSDFDLWVKLDVGGEEPVWRVGTVSVA